MSRNQHIQVATIATNASNRVHVRALALMQVRAQRNAARVAVKQQVAFQAQVAQLAAQYGLPAPSFSPAVAANARANSATVTPSRELVSVNGVAYKPCKAVHALCEQLPNGTRAEMMQLCKDNGINAATASTQVGIYRKAVAAKQEEVEAE